MAFNLAGFNRTAFNSGSDSTIYLTECYIQETITPAVGTSLEAYLTAIINERVTKNQFLIGNGIYVSGTGSESVLEEVSNAELSIIISGIATEIVGMQTRVASESNLTATASEIIGCEGEIASNIWGKGTGSEVIEPVVWTDKETYMTLTFSEFVNSVATTEANDINICYLDIDLQPDDVLIIDASTYNVWLNGQNVNWVQSGEWIDEMVRETTSINITANGGVSNLSASIFFTERYL